MEFRRLIDVDGCVYDAELFQHSHGFESLDSVGREAFVNHIHVSGNDRELKADRIIDAWRSNMASVFPDRVFRIYRHLTEAEIVLRFHAERTGVANWYEGNEGELLLVGTQA